MTDLFYSGGPLFMSILTILLITLIAVGILSFVKPPKATPGPISPVLVKEIGILALIIGVSGQFIGLYSAFTLIEQAGTVSQSVLMSGLKISSITTMYGLLICAIGYLIYFGLQFRESKSTV